MLTPSGPVGWANDLETVPLLKEQKEQKETSVDPFSARYARPNEHGEADCFSIPTTDSWEAMMYSTRGLTTWESFLMSGSTVWANKALWTMMVLLLLVATLACAVTLLVIPDPATLKVSRFTEVSKFLNVVVGLLLGFFLSSSMQRWHACVDGFLELLDAVRNLQMQFTALGVPEAQTIMCLRYGLSSAWLLYGQLLVETKSMDREKMWTSMQAKVARFDFSGKTMFLEPWEIDVLRKTRDPPGMMWTWVAALIGRLAQDKWIPPMSSPTYTSLLQLCQNAHVGIRHVREKVSVQTPLTYTHMLSTLVHINNLLNAVTFGVVAGISLGTTLIVHGLHPYKQHGKATMIESELDLQSTVVTFMYCFLGPLLYTALLIISMHLAQPFDHEDSKIPMHRLLDMLESDLVNGREVTEHLAFEKPFYHEPKLKDLAHLAMSSAKVEGVDPTKSLQSSA